MCGFCMKNQVDGEVAEVLDVFLTEDRIEERRLHLSWYRFAVTYTGLMTCGASR